MTRIAALGHPALWQAALALRERGCGYAEIARQLAEATGRPMPLTTVYRLVEYGRERTGRETVVLALGRDAAVRARGCTAARLIERAVALLLEVSALLDAVLDDGIRTPGDCG